MQFYYVNQPKKKKKKKKKSDVVMHLDIYEWIWFKLGTTIDSIELYILILA